MMVAPLAGAWVEMSNSVLKKPEYIVAPLAGAWVEIISLVDNFVHGYRRSPRGSVG